MSLMRMRGFALVALVCAACGGAPPEYPAEPEPAQALDADDCPSSFADASGGCDEPNGYCEYPEGVCSCGSSSYCGGVDPGPDWTPPPPTWRCRYGADQTRPDGCPGQAPEDESACAEEGKQCAYGDCCFLPVRCEAGRWVHGQDQCPP